MENEVLTEPESPAFDMEKAVDSMAADLFPARESAVDETPETTPETVATEPLATSPVAPAAQVSRPAPKAWAKEVHPVWDKLDDAAKDQIEKREKQILEGLDQYKDGHTYAQAMREVVKPYEPMLRASGLDAPKAFQILLHAHHRLTQGPMESRRAAMLELAKNSGIELNGAAPTETAPVDPTVKALQERLDHIQGSLTAREQAEYATAQAAAKAEVDAFAGDTKAHPHFDAVADDIALYIKAGATLQDAYDKAVWANPVTRQKELAASQTAFAEKQKEIARLEGLPKKKAAGVNVRGRETQRAPTDPLGSFEDTLRSTLTEIKGRA